MYMYVEALTGSVLAGTLHRRETTSHVHVYVEALTRPVLAGTLHRRETTSHVHVYVEALTRSVDLHLLTINSNK